MLWRHILFQLAFSDTSNKYSPLCPQPGRDFYPIPTPARPTSRRIQMPKFEHQRPLYASRAVGEADLLPVMVFIHGGAFTYSTGSSRIYDARMLASSSREEKISRSTIFVTMNYRLGVYGFLAGRDLEEYNKAHGESGVGNYGIWDQIIALRWIKRYISAFGGGPQKITLFGQSAGSFSVHLHLLREEALFSSAILQSGLMVGVNSVDEYQVIYDKILQQLGIPLDMAAKDRVDRLLSTPQDKLTQAMVPVFVVPLVTMALCDDGHFIRGRIPRLPEVDGKCLATVWRKRIVLGDCRNEGIIFNKSWSNMSERGASEPGPLDLAVPSAPVVMDRLVEVLGENKAAEVADLYQLARDETSDTIFSKLELLTTLGLFSLSTYLATKSLASVCPNTVYAWHFDVPSPYDNPWKGLAHHSFDNVLLWGILKHTLPGSIQKVADLMSEAWIKFSRGSVLQRAKGGWSSRQTQMLEDGFEEGGRQLGIFCFRSIAKESSCCGCGQSEYGAVSSGGGVAQLIISMCQDKYVGRCILRPLHTAHANAIVTSSSGWMLNTLKQ